MTGDKLLLIVLAAASLAFAVPSANAQATRTWVSGVGDDANPCSRTAPCKTFAGAISKTAAGGEINALDPGGFGAVTITKAITIDGGGGQVASTLVAGTNGIVVSAPATATVTLRNLRINGIVGTAERWPERRPVSVRRRAAHRALHDIRLHPERHKYQSEHGDRYASVFVTDTIVSNSRRRDCRPQRWCRKDVCVDATGDRRSKQQLRAESRWLGGAGSIIAAVSDSLITRKWDGQCRRRRPGRHRGHPDHPIDDREQYDGWPARRTRPLAVHLVFLNNLITGNGTGLSAISGGNLLTYKNNSVDGNFTTGAFTGALIPE